MKPFLPLSQLIDLGHMRWGDESFSIGQHDEPFSLFEQRNEFRRNYGYVQATAEVMKRLADFLSCYGLVLDAGSGSGYLSHELVRLGVDMLAVDHCDYRMPRPDGKGYPIRAVHKLDMVCDASNLDMSRFGAVLLAWPPLSQNFALNVAQAMLPSQVLIYEGEMEGGCNATSEFFAFMGNSKVWVPLDDLTASLNDVHVVTQTLHDCWKAWERTPNPI